MTIKKKNRGSTTFTVEFIALFQILGRSLNDVGLGRCNDAHKSVPPSIYCINYSSTSIFHCPQTDLISQLLQSSTTTHGNEQLPESAPRSLSTSRYLTPTPKISSFCYLFLIFFQCFAILFQIQSEFSFLT